MPKLLSQSTGQTQDRRRLLKMGHTGLDLTQAEKLGFPTPLEFRRDQAIIRVHRLVLASSQLGLILGSLQLLGPLLFKASPFGCLVFEQRFERIQLRRLERLEKSFNDELVKGRSIQEQTGGLVEATR